MKVNIITPTTLDALWRRVQETRDCSRSCAASLTNQTQARADEDFWRANREYEAAVDTFIEQSQPPWDVA